MKAFVPAFRLICVAATLLAAQPALAQSDNTSGYLWTVSIGGGGAFTPRFPGAKDLELKPWPLFDIRKFGTDPAFETPDQSTGFALIKEGGLRLGPAITLESGRDEEDAIAGIGDVKLTVEAGAFAEAYISESLRLRGEVRKGFGGHKGLVSDVGADFIIGKTSEPFQFSVGPRVRLADSKYMRAFYGVNSEQAALTGLAPHDPKGGVYAAGAVATANYRINSVWGVEGYGRYDRLMGDAADSPLVRSAVGSRNQFEAGLGLTYSFGL